VLRAVPGGPGTDPQAHPDQHRNDKSCRQQVESDIRHLMYLVATLANAIGQLKQSVSGPPFARYARYRTESAVLFA